MTRPPVTAEHTTALRASADHRLLSYSLIALGGLAGAALAGQPALVALAVPFALALALGLRRTRPIDVTARLSLDSRQVLEDDDVAARLEVEWDGGLDVDVMLFRLRGVTPPRHGRLAWSLSSAVRSIRIPIHLRAAQWGRHTPFEVWVRVAAPFGLVTWTGRVVTAPTLRVLPGNERLSRLLDPAASRAVLGAHRSRRLGQGGEFAEVGPYAPGDRLRDLNWSATARYRRPFVNRYNPELSGDVVIAIDAFGDGSTGSTEALGRAARAAWALASIHLRANDRVGLAGLGGRTHWLAPAGGRLARYRLLETLLSIGGEAARLGDARAGHPATVPASALVIALTPLHDDVTVRTLQAWRARGRSVAVVMVETADLLDEPATEAAALARRLWRIGLDRRRRELTGLGIPVVTTTAHGAITPVVTALRRARRAPSLRRR